MDRLEKSCEYLNWWHAAGAVLDVFRQNQRREGDASCVHKASADDWAIVDELRQDVWRRARSFWSGRTGLDESRFPYSPDGTARLYFRYRKRSPQEVDAFAAEIAAKTGTQASLFA